MTLIMNRLAVRLKATEAHIKSVAKLIKTEGWSFQHHEAIKADRIRVFRLQNEMDSITEKYAVLSCRKIFDAIRVNNKFPNEVCDMVYRYLRDADTVEVHHSQTYLTCGKADVPLKGCYECFDLLAVYTERLVDPFHVIAAHTTVAKNIDIACLIEMTKLWYEEIIFTVQIPRMLGSPINKNVWGLSFDSRERSNHFALIISWEVVCSHLQLVNLGTTYLDLT